jgi:myosin-3
MFTGLTYDVGIPWVQSLPSPEGVWELVETIGEGTYGEVYKGRNCKTGETAAVKIMDAILDKEEDIKAELSIFERYWKHPNIVLFFGAFLKRDQIADDRIWLVMELCTHGSVTDLVRAMHDEGASLPEDIIGYLMKEVLSGLSFLHSQHYMHRDVKGQNCLLTTHGRVKLVDFGELQSCEGIIYDILTFTLYKA